MIVQILERIEGRLAATKLSAASASTKAGLSIDAIRNIRRRVAKGNDRGTVNVGTLVALARVLGTTAAYLATGEQETNVPNIDVDEPNRVLDCQVRVISVDEAHLGVLELETEQGFIPVVINRNVAYLLISELAAFMAADEVTEVIPEPSNDG